ncbi:proteasome complex subunit Rpn13 ubiquitin receptor-domain-containing protein [Coprinopsis sp. MPI-PUGE-AT-0042]|nr:proteasome complex subunit Rpn13 ubiquitin receptor-domain-containing protein [Coprinopsis sp. MPI-PUGE-AT-0042]
MSETLLAFKAGRAFRRGSTNHVDSDPTKGAVLLTNGDDGLLHFIWKNRSTGENEEDLILFPTDATFSKVTQSNGRVYVLKFSSSNQRHFFWMQNAASQRDEEFAKNLNGLLQDPDYELEWNVEIQDTSAQGLAARGSTTGGASDSSSSTQPASSSSGGQDNAEFLAQMRRLLQNPGAARGTAAQAESDADALELTDILTPANLRPLFDNHPDLVSTLFPHLPSDLPVPPSPEVLQRVVNSPQFRSAAATLDRGLRTGLLGGLVRQLGLPEEAGLGIAPFLKAIQEKADRENREAGNRMDTD